MRYSLVEIDPDRIGVICRHLEKPNELLQIAHDKMNLEMHKLQVEQEMLMRKFYQVMIALDHTKKVANPMECVAEEFAPSKNVNLQISSADWVTSEEKKDENGQLCYDYEIDSVGDLELIT